VTVCDPPPPHAAKANREPSAIAKSPLRVEMIRPEVFIASRAGAREEPKRLA